MLLGATLSQWGQMDHGQFVATRSLLHILQKVLGDSPRDRLICIPCISLYFIPLVPFFWFLELFLPQ